VLLNSPPFTPKVKLPEKAVACETGVPAGLSLTVAVSVTTVPNGAGFGVATSVVTVAALLAVNIVELALVRKLVSPEYVAE
jgi:hypothetical protein